MQDQLRVHVETLLELGWTKTGIASTAKVGERNINRALCGEGLSPALEAALLALPKEEYTAGTRPHLRQLAELGWRQRDIAAEAGVPEQIVARIVSPAGYRPSQEVRDALLDIPLEPYQQGMAERLARLVELGWPLEEIAQQTGTSQASLQAVAEGRGQLPAAEARALRGLPLVYSTQVTVNGCGTRRRVQALACMGWPSDEVADLAWITKAQLQGYMRPHRRVPREVMLDIAQVYAELREACGPADWVATRARNQGHVPPAGWDDEAIDDPNGLPRTSTARPEPEMKTVEVNPARKTDRKQWRWQDDADCKDEDTNLFYGYEGEAPPERRQREQIALKICSGCAVRTECLEYALQWPERDGIWGGRTEKERRNIRRARRGKAGRVRKDAA